MRNRILAVSPGRFSQLAFLIAALSVASARTGAQQTKTVRDPPICSRCQIRLDHSVTRTGRPSSEVGEPLTLARMSDGLPALERFEDSITDRCRESLMKTSTTIQS
jgi:hypothetical protein